MTTIPLKERAAQKAVRFIQMNDMATIKQTPAQFHDEALAAIRAARNSGELAIAHDRYLAGEEYLHAGPEAVADLEAAYRDKLAWLWGIGA